MRSERSLLDVGGVPMNDAYDPWSVKPIGDMYCTEYIPGVLCHCRYLSKEATAAQNTVWRHVPTRKMMLNEIWTVGHKWIYVRRIRHVDTCMYASITICKMISFGHRIAGYQAGVYRGLKAILFSKVSITGWCWWCPWDCHPLAIHLSRLSHKIFGISGELCMRHGKHIMWKCVTRLRCLKDSIIQQTCNKL